MVLRLEILVGFAVPVEVGDSAYITGLGLHENGASPFSMPLGGLGIEENTCVNEPDQHFTHASLLANLA